MPANPPPQAPSIDGVTTRNSTQVNLSIQLAGGKLARVGRVQSISESISNNVQALMELGSQVMVELKKGVTQYTFTIAKMYVVSDVFDQLAAGQIFGLEITDDSVSGVPGSGTVLELFSSCSITSISRTYTSGQATVAQNASVVTIGSSQAGS